MGDIKAYSTTKKFPLYAGMQFTYPETKNNRVHLVGYRWVKFIYDTKEMDRLISEKEVKRFFL